MKISAAKCLVAATVLAYLVQLTAPLKIETLFALWPLQPIDGIVGFRLWQILSYAFLHDPVDIRHLPFCMLGLGMFSAAIAHLLFNMFGLGMFGAEIERYVGPWRLLSCYFASVVTAAVCQLFVPALLGSPPAPTIGASGGVFGLLLAYALLFPTRKVIPLIPPIPMPAWLFATLYAGIELYLGATNTLPGVAHFAHLGGMLGSAVVVLQWRAAAKRRR